MKNKTVVIVLNYNCYKFLPECLKSLFNQTAENYEVWVIDNNSQDKSKNYLREIASREHRVPFKLIENNHNFGVGRAFNQAIKKAIGQGFKRIALMNADVRADRNWLQESLKTLEKNNKIAICASLSLDWQGETIDSAGGAIRNLFFGVFVGFLGGEKITQIPKEYRQEEFSIFSGLVTAMMIRVAVFKKYGLFDPDYFMYFEDVDLSWRILLGGEQIVVNPRARVFHWGHGSSPDKKLSLRLLSQTETNLLTVYYKNLSLGVFILLFLPLIASRTVFSLGYLLISPKITMAKLVGIINFFIKLILGKYRSSRRLAQRNRKINDKRVFKHNPYLPFKFDVIKIGLSWIKDVRRVYNS